MSKSKRFKVNSRNMLALSAAPKPSDKREHYKLMHVSEQGTTVTDGNRLVRVSLPLVDGKSQAALPSGAVPLPMARELARSLPLYLGSFQTEPELQPCEDAPDYDKMLAQFDRSPVLAEVAVNAALLGDLLRAAERFSDHERKIIRLRIVSYGKAGAVRIDARPTEGEQEFFAMLTGISNPSGFDADADGSAPCNSQVSLLLPETNGRKYREE